MGLMKNKSLNAFTRAEKEVSIAFGAIPVKRTRFRAEPEVYIGVNSKAGSWSAVLVYMRDIEELTGRDKTRSAKLLFSLAIAVASIKLYTLWPSGSASPHWFCSRKLKDSDFSFADPTVNYFQARANFLANQS